MRVRAAAGAVSDSALSGVATFSSKVNLGYPVRRISAADGAAQPADAISAARPADAIGVVGPERTHGKCVR